MDRHKGHAGPSAPGSGASKDVTDTLVLLAASCEASGHPLQAIHCLATLLAHGRLVRSQEARARCAMGRLMLQHTTNSKAAHKELLAAQALAKDLLGAVSLQCEIACQLAQYFQSQGEVQYQVQLYDQALSLCGVGTAASEGPVLHRWTSLLHLLKAQALAYQGDVTRTVQAVQAGQAYCNQHMAQHGPLIIDVLLHMQLFLMQLHMMAESEEGYLAAEVEAVKLLHQLPTVLTGSDGTLVIPAGFLPAAQLHFRLLQVLHLLLSGRLDRLLMGPNGEPGGLQSGPGPELEALAARAAGQDAGYHWLSAPLVSSLISLISAVVHLFRSKLRLATEQVDQGLAVLDTVLQDMGLAADTVSERSLDAVSLLQCRPPLALHVQLMLVRAGGCLAALDLVGAQAALTPVMDLAGRFPIQLRLMLFPLHLVTAQYCHATGDYAAAARHLQAVKLHTPPGRRTHILASAMLAITLLSDPGSLNNPSALEAAIEALGASQYTKHQELEKGDQLCPLEDVVSHLAVALIKIRLDQPQDSRMVLTRILQIAHTNLSHYALVSQIMATMIPLQAATGDVAGAHGMAKSCSMLSRHHPDLQVMVHRALSALCEQQGATGAEEAARAASVAEMNTQEVAARVQEARQQAAHNQLLAWGLKSA